MKKQGFIILLALAVTIMWSCSVSEPDQNSEIEDAILSLIAADDSTYGIEGMDDVEDDDLSLGKSVSAPETEQYLTVETALDSSYIWRFGRSDMQTEREITVEVESDSSAVALISHHVTGIFHVRQFERVWTSSTTWERGDSVRFSEKTIDMTINRRVAFRKRTLPDGSERWLATAMTLAYGSSGDALDIQSLEWIAEDSVRVLDAFETTFYSRGEPLSLSIMGANQMNVIVSNDVADEAEAVIARLGFNPRVHDPNLRNRIHLQYVETLDSGDKVYSRSVPASQHPLRYFKGFIEVMDMRTLFDHDFTTYQSATLGFIYTMRRHVHP
jgi:hypothetical protein